MILYTLFAMNVLSVAINFWAAVDETPSLFPRWIFAGLAFMNAFLAGLIFSRIVELGG